MTHDNKNGSRGAALVLVGAGLLTVLASSWTWGTCPTTPCGGIFQAFSDYSGLDLGFGYVTALAGLGLTAIGLGSLRRKGVSRFATTAPLIALLVVLAVGASLIWMYVIPGDDKQFRPPSWSMVVGIAGLIALAASLRLRRSMPHGL